MNMRKTVLIRLAVALVLVCVILPAHGESNGVPTSHKLQELLVSKRLEEVHLTIYYMNPHLLTWIPVSVNDLIDKQHQYMVVVKGIRLNEHAELIERMANTPLIMCEDSEDFPDSVARIYYVFETDENEVIYSVAMHGNNNNIFINEIAVEEDAIFYDVIMPFLPKDAADELNEYVKARQ